MSAPEVRLTDDERETLRRALPGRVRPGEGVEAVEGIVAARLAAQAERGAAAVETYSPCHGGEELNADHIRYCTPFHEWRDALAAALRGDT